MTGSRDRKRARRRKRKQRAARREAEPVPPPPDPGGTSANGEGTAGLSRSQLKDRAAREALVPLRQGERPTAVTVGAIIAAVIAAVFWGSAAVAVTTDTEVGGSEPGVAPLVLFAAILTVMAYGMWRARYWAVLGFQALLVLIMLAAGLGLVGVQTVLQAIGTTLLLAGAGTLFYFLVKALARIQMPQRLPRE